MRPNMRPLGLACLIAALVWHAPPLRAAEEEGASIAPSLPFGAQAERARKTLAGRGITYSLVYTGEVLSNVRGGIQRGSVYQGKLEGIYNADLEKLMGWKGLTFFANGFQLQRSGAIGHEYVGNLNTISNIEALPHTRLSEVWLEQKFAGDRFSLRFGQLAADREFFVADWSDFFLTSDWPAIAKQNLPNGGPAYPLSTPAVRLKVEPTSQVTLLAAVFNGDPAGPYRGVLAGPEAAEVSNPHGLNFRVNDPPLAIAEMQYRYNQGKEDNGLAGIVRLGGWYHFGKFDDPRFSTDGLALANPASNRMPRRLPGNSGVYGVIDQQIYRPAGGGPDSGIGVFSRISASPSDRNVINFYLDGGIVANGPFASRPNDKIGATFIYSRVAGAQRAADQDIVVYSGIPGPIRNHELSIELSYLAQIVPGWTLQPDFQYVVNPGGRAPDPTAQYPQAIRNAMVVGLRSVIRY